MIGLRKPQANQDSLYALVRVSDSNRHDLVAAFWVTRVYRFHNNSTRYLFDKTRLETRVALVALLAQQAMRRPPDTTGDCQEVPSQPPVGITKGAKRSRSQRAIALKWLENLFSRLSATLAFADLANCDDRCYRYRIKARPGMLGTMSEIDPFAAAGTVVTAFMAGAAMFYGLGRKSGHQQLQAKLENKTREIREQSSKFNSLHEELDQSKKRIADLEMARVPPPPREQANQLVQALLQNEDDVWLVDPVLKPKGHDDRVASMHTKIISIANLKGGVGKTTTTANLAAYLDVELKKRVLVIDADYQGSLSAVLNRIARTPEPSTTTARWLGGIEDHEEEVRRIDRVGNDLPNTRYLSAFYDLSNIETRLMIEWLLSRMLQEPARPDLRYAFSRILHSPSVQTRYDYVLIDCPPRLSTATINALCASTHLLIPSVPDYSSLEAAANFLKMYRRVTARLNHNIQLLGVAPMLTMGTTLNDDEISNLDNLKKRVRLFGGGAEPYVFNRNIPRNVPIARLAGSGIAVLRATAPVKRLFKDFGAEVVERVSAERAVLPIAAE